MHTSIDHAPGGGHVGVASMRITQALSRHAYGIGIGLSLLIGLLIRGWYIVSSDFPLHDGGLFYVMVEDLLANGFQVPPTTSFNHDTIPFAYSPLAFYAAAALHALSGMSLADVFRVIPLAATTLTVVAFWRFAESMLGRTSTVVAATAAFAIIPRTFLWNIMGGGLTRSLGFLFALLALHALYRFYTASAWRHAATALAWSVLTVLVHIGTIPFLVFSSVLFLAFYGRHRTALMGSLAIAGGTALLTAPWWASVLATHGAETFIAAQATGGSLFSSGVIRNRVVGQLARLGVAAWTGGTTAEPLFPLLGSLGLLGVLAAFTKERIFLPVWWVVILVLDSRQGLTFATVPMAMLAGIAITDIVVPTLERTRGFVRTSGHSLSWVTKAVLAFVALYSIGSALLNSPAYSSDLRLLSSMRPEERQAMQWVARTIPIDARFVVIPESDWTHWGASRNAEWFPALANRVSVNTVQGTEWSPRPTFDRRLAAYNALMPCASALASCLDEWVQNTGLNFTHVYIPQPSYPPKLQHLRCCEALIESLNGDARYERIYDGPGAVIFAKRAP